MFECFSGEEELQVFAIANVVYLIVTLKILIVNSLAWLNSATLKSIFQNFLRHVGNWPRIHRNPRQFTWCSFIHSNESQSRSFLNSLTHRYIRHNKLVLIAWYCRLPQYTWNLTYVIIKWLTFSSILSVIKVHFVTVPWTYRRPWANYLAINVAINLTYNKAKRIKICYDICKHTVGAQFPTDIIPGHNLRASSVGPAARASLKACSQAIPDRDLYGVLYPVRKYNIVNLGRPIKIE